MTDYITKEAAIKLADAAEAEAPKLLGCVGEYHPDLWKVEAHLLCNAAVAHYLEAQPDTTALEYMTGYSDGKQLAEGQAQPLTKAQIDELYIECGREVAKLDAEDRYTFAAWFPIAIRLAEKAHGIGGSV